MDLMRLLVRLAIWVRRPPSRRWMYIAVATLIFCIVIVAIEWAGFWPEALRADRVRIPR